MHDEVMAAVPTPFGVDGGLDLAAAATVVERVAPHVDGIFLAGTTGEFAALTPLDRRRLAEVALRILEPDRVVMHVGAVSTHEALAVVRAVDGLPLTRFAAITPMVHRVHDETVVRHFGALRHALDGRTLYAYAYPEIAGNALSPDAYAALGDVTDGVKASGTATTLLPRYLRARREAAAWTGDDGALTAHLAIGGTGTVSGCASVFPQVWADLARAIRTGVDLEHAQDRVDRVRRAIGGGTAHLKLALDLLGVAAGPTRMALDRLTAAEVEAIRELVSSEARTTSAAAP